MKSFQINPSLMGGLNACAALHNDEHWAVYISLIHHGDIPMHDLAQKFKATYHELALILDDLINGGLVEEFTVWDEDIGGDYSRIYYRATIVGLRFYARMMEVIFPAKDNKRFLRRRKRYEKYFAEDD